MVVKELIEKLSKYPENYPVVLLDETTDEESASCYGITDSKIGEVDLFKYPDEEKGYKGIAISFKNKLNENPI